MANTITAGNFGAWVIKCNPTVWDLEQFIADGNDYIDDWSVVHNYRSEMMAPGDPVVFWVTGFGAEPPGGRRVGRRPRRGASKRRSASH